MAKTNKCPAIRVVMMPSDTNGLGSIFGGVILSHIDLAGAVEARSICDNRIVTRFMRSVQFTKPVKVGDVLTCWATVTKIGKTSITTEVEVQAQRPGGFVPVTKATVVYVAIDEHGKKTEVKLLPGVRRKLRGCLVGCGHDKARTSTGGRAAKKPSARR
jgi:acyl-CoA thioesterase YciA